MNDVLQNYLDRLVAIWPPVAQMREASNNFWNWSDEDISWTFLYGDIARSLIEVIESIPDDVASEIADSIDTVFDGDNEPLRTVMVTGC